MNSKKIGFSYYGFDLEEVQLILLGLIERQERLEALKKPNEYLLKDIEDSKVLIKKLLEVEANLCNDDDDD